MRKYAPVSSGVELTEQDVKEGGCNCPDFHCDTLSYMLCTQNILSSEQNTNTYLRHLTLFPSKISNFYSPLLFSDKLTGLALKQELLCSKKCQICTF